MPEAPAFGARSAEARRLILAVTGGIGSGNGSGSGSGSGRGNDSNNNSNDDDDTTTTTTNPFALSPSPSGSYVKILRSEGEMRHGGGRFHFDARGVGLFEPYLPAAATRERDGGCGGNAPLRGEELVAALRDDTAAGVSRLREFSIAFRGGSRRRRRPGRGRGLQGPGLRAVPVRREGVGRAAAGGDRREEGERRAVRDSAAI